MLIWCPIFLKVSAIYRKATCEMAHTIIRKKIGLPKAVISVSEPPKPVVIEPKESPKPVEIKKKKKEKNMDAEKIRKAEELSGVDPSMVKVLKKEKGLIERTESSKIILTEDNRQVLND